MTSLRFDDVLTVGDDPWTSSSPAQEDHSDDRLAGVVEYPNLVDHLGGQASATSTPSPVEQPPSITPPRGAPGPAAAWGSAADVSWWDPAYWLGVPPKW